MRSATAPACAGATKVSSPVSGMTAKDKESGLGIRSQTTGPTPSRIPALSCDDAPPLGRVPAGGQCWGRLCYRRTAACPCLASERDSRKACRHRAAGNADAPDRIRRQVRPFSPQQPSVQVIPAMRIIAIEEHMLPSFVREAWEHAPPPYDPVSQFADGGLNGDRLAELGEGRIALMDEQGVDVQVDSDLVMKGVVTLMEGIS